MLKDIGIMLCNEAVNALAKNVKITINMTGWPAAVACTACVTGLSAVAIAGIVASNNEQRGPYLPG